MDSRLAYQTETKTLNLLRHDNLPHDTIEGKMLGKATLARKRMNLVHDMIEGRYYGQLKDLI